MRFAPQLRAILPPHLARWLRTRRFSEPTLGPFGTTNQWKKHDELPLSYLFAHLHLLASHSLSSLIISLFVFFSLTLPTSAFPTVHIVRSLISKLPSTNKKKSGKPKYEQSPNDRCQHMFEQRLQVQSSNIHLLKRPPDHAKSVDSPCRAHALTTKNGRNSGIALGLGCRLGDPYSSTKALMKMVENMIGQFLIWLMVINCYSLYEINIKKIWDDFFFSLFLRRRPSGRDRQLCGILPVGYCGYGFLWDPVVMILVPPKNSDMEGATIEPLGCAIPTLALQPGNNLQFRHA